jgi:hypothetical protein
VRIPGARLSLKFHACGVEAEAVETLTIANEAASEPEDGRLCVACQAELVPAQVGPSPVSADRIARPAADPGGLPKWLSRGTSIALLVLAVGVGFLIPILCSLVAIGVGVAALISSRSGGTMVKQLAVASLILGVVGVIGTIALLSGA